MTLKNKSVLVTGGAGFIGSHLVDAIQKDEPDEIIVVDNLYLGKKKNIPDEIQLYVENVSDYNTMESICNLHSTDIVFNLAVVPLPASLEKPEWTFKQNIDMMLSLCELARNDFFHTMIHFSSSEAYGTNISETTPMSEDHPLNGTTTYAASKAASDLLLMSYVRTFGIDAAIIRPFNNYGPRQNEGSYAGVIPLTINRILKGEAPIIFGDGKQTRDYLFVKDTARAAIEIYNKKVTRGRVLNIASGIEISIEHVIKRIMREMGYFNKIKYEPERIGDVRRHIANIYLSEDLIGFKPETSFDKGIEETVRWYCGN